MLAAVSLTFLLQLAVIYLPFLQDLFETTALSAGDLLLSLALGSIIFWVVELKKWFVRRQGGSAFKMKRPYM
jgi:Ca2+-transporting ATPase